MKIFESPQQPFMQSEFCQMLNELISLKYINEVPTFNGKRTFFWSTIKFDGIKLQYLISNSFGKPLKYFFIKFPQTYKETLNSYKKSFRRQVKQAEKNNLSCEVIISPSIKDMEACYSIYLQNMIKLHSIAFPSQFFFKACGLPYSYIFAARKDEEIVSFALLFGNLMFIQSSTEQGRLLRANNLLYDMFYKCFENHPVFLGTSFPDSGQYYFKISSGAIPIPVNPTKQDLVLSIFKQSIVRNNRLAVPVHNLARNPKIFKRLFPY